MSTFFWVCGAAIGVFVAWWAIKILATYIIPAERSGVVLLKQQLSQAGVDVRKIPDAALDEIVKILIHRSRATASIARIAGNMPNEMNWRANLVRNIQAYTGIICEILAYGPDQWPDDEMMLVFKKYNLVKINKTQE